MGETSRGKHQSILLLLSLLLLHLLLLLLLLLLLKMLPSVTCSKKTTIATGLKLGTLVAHRPLQCLWVVWAPHIKAQLPQGPWNEIKVISSVASSKRMAIATGPILSTLLPLNPYHRLWEVMATNIKAQGPQGPWNEIKGHPSVSSSKKTTIVIGPILGTLIALYP